MWTGIFPTYITTLDQYRAAFLSIFNKHRLKLKITLISVDLQQNEFYHFN